MKNMEIERQFLVTDMVAVPLGQAAARHRIEQGYLSFEPELRIRHMDAQYFFTFKSAGGLVRREEEFAITAEDYAGLRERIQGEMLVKQRYELQLLTGETAVYDVYEGALQGLCMAEVEFPSVEAAQAFTPPTWFGQEITYDARLTAANLVQHGWAWFEKKCNYI